MLPKLITSEISFRANKFYRPLKMISDRFESENDLDVNMTKVLLGPLGTRILLLISQGCETPDDLVRFSSVSYECLDVKIPLLLNLELIHKLSSSYKTTIRGEAYLSAIAE